MSNRRNFIAVMVGTASLGVLSNLGKSVINPSYAQNKITCSINNDTLKEALKLGFGVLTALVTAIGNLAGAAKSASDSALESLSAEVEKAADADIAFWSDSDNFAGFIRGITVDEQTRAAQAVKGKFNNKQITDAVNEALKNLEANNISAIERDPIIGSVVKAGYTAAINKLKEASAQRKTAEAGLAQAREVIGVKIETEITRLKKESKITNGDIQKYGDVFPSVAPRLRKVIDLKVSPINPGIRQPGSELQRPDPGQLIRPNSSLINQLSLDADGIADASASSRNEFDTYVEIFESRLLALASPTNGEGELTIVDRLLGIEKANALPPVIILAIVIIGGVLVLTVTGAVSDAVRNRLCAQAILKLKGLIDCNKRAVATRRSRLDEARRSFNRCRADLPSFLRFLCIPGNTAERAAIEVLYARDVAACYV
jgi:predicted RNase H-like HicB family nuclease